MRIQQTTNWCYFSFFFFQENRFWQFMQIAPIGDNLHELSKSVFWENRYIINMSSAENFMRSAKSLQIQESL